VKKGFKKTLVNKVTVTQQRSNFTAESIYTRHLKFGIKYSGNVRLKAERGHQILTGILPLSGLFVVK